MTRTQPSVRTVVVDATERYPFDVVRAWIRERGAGVADLAFGRDLAAPPGDAVEVIRTRPESLLDRAREPDLARFAGCAASFLSREYGARVDPARILHVPGGRPGVAAAATLAAPGDAALVVEPAYPTFAHVARERGLALHHRWQDPERGFEPSVPGGSDAGSDFRIIAITHPTNPTGATLSASTVASLTPALARGGVLFNDATYGPLTHAEAPASLFSGDGPRDARAIELHALSKCFGMTGVPISFLVGTPDEIDRLRTFAGFAWTPPSVGQIEIAIRCLSNADHLAALRDATRRRAERLRVTLEALGLRPYASGGGIFVICPAPRAIDGHDTPTPWDAARRLLDTHGVAAMPWPARPHGYLRFTASARPEDVDALASLRGSVRFEW